MYLNTSLSSAIYRIIDFMLSFLNVLDSKYLFVFPTPLSTISISLLDILISAVIMGMVVNFYWKGARGF